MSKRRRRQINQLEDYLKYLSSTLSNLVEYMDTANDTIRKLVSIIVDFARMHTEYGFHPDFASKKINQVNSITQKFFKKSKKLWDDLNFINSELSDAKKVNLLLEEFLRRKFKKIVDEYMMMDDDADDLEFVDEAIPVENSQGFAPIPSALVEKMEGEGKRKTKRKRRK